MRRLALGALVMSAAVAAAAMSAAPSGRAAPHGYALLTIGRAGLSRVFRRTDGGGVVTSIQTGLDLQRQPARIRCRLASVDRTGKTPYQSDPQGTCAVYFRTDRVITLTARPDFRSADEVGWMTFDRQHPSVVAPACERAFLLEGCIAVAPTLKIVVGGHDGLYVDFRLRVFDLNVVNEDASFGEAEDHGRLQLPLYPPIDCGLTGDTCSAPYEYGTKPVLDALWDVSQRLKVLWEGCDAHDPIASNEALCPVTMTRDRTVTVSWP